MIFHYFIKVFISSAIIIFVSEIAKKDNIIGCQFHPEKSSKQGLKIIENFLKDNL